MCEMTPSAGECSMKQFQGSIEYNPSVAGTKRAVELNLRTAGRLGDFRS